MLLIATYALLVNWSDLSLSKFRAKESMMDVLLVGLDVLEDFQPLL